MTNEEASTISGWLTGRLPDEWFVEAPEVSVDREEITVLGRIAEPDVGSGDEAAVRQAREGRISRFREVTREHRIEIAREAEHRFEKKMAWGATCGDARVLFTHLAVPAMTRLRQPERMILDTLVASGVARSRSEALGWCVKLVGQHAEGWLGELRDAVAGVDRVREQGPAV